MKSFSSQIVLVISLFLIDFAVCQNATTAIVPESRMRSTTTEVPLSSVTEVPLSSLITESSPELTTTPVAITNETYNAIDTAEILKQFETALLEIVHQPDDANSSHVEVEVTSSTSPVIPTVSYSSFNESVNGTSENPDDLLIPPAQIDASIQQINATKQKDKIVIKTESDCPSLEDADKLSQTQLISRLTHGCRYDRLERPSIMENGTKTPVKVFTRAYIYFLQNLEAHDLQFKIHMLFQMRYVDPRLVFKEVAPSRKEPIVGEQSLRDTLWVPHVFFANERSSDILGTAEKDILTSVSPDGTIIISTRIQATLYCWMNLQKFPFDSQHCSTILESWMYNESDLVLHWEPKSPVTLAPELHLTEYVLLDFWSNETVINANLSDLRHGAFAGNYSSLSFTVHLSREMGFYLMDYFIPSVMLVAISWVTFWLQADQSAPRITLGTSTMLTFITLASAQGKTLPKVSYIKASEIWFLGCTGFIFGSLVEFAFVNTIWRRKNNVQLKKVNSKYILKSTLTPRLARKELGGLQKSHSCTSLDGQPTATPPTPSFNNYLTVHSFPSKTNSQIPIIKTDSFDNNSVMINVDTGSVNNLHELTSEDKSGFTTMTPQEIAIWIDKRSRLVFPIAFLIFNIFYWSFVLSI